MRLLGSTSKCSIEHACIVRRKRAPVRTGGRNARPELIRQREPGRANFVFHIRLANSRGERAPEPATLAPPFAVSARLSASRPSARRVRKSVSFEMRFRNTLPLLFEFGTKQAVVLNKEMTGSHQFNSCKRYVYVYESCFKRFMQPVNVIKLERWCIHLIHPMRCLGLCVSMPRISRSVKRITTQSSIQSAMVL